MDLEEAGLGWNRTGAQARRALAGRSPMGLALRLGLITHWSMAPVLRSSMPRRPWAGSPMKSHRACCFWKPSRISWGKKWLMVGILGEIMDR